MLRSLETGDLAEQIRLQIYDGTAKAIQNGNTNTQLNRKKSDGRGFIYNEFRLLYAAKYIQFPEL